jgi:hypothetical protein
VGDFCSIFSSACSVIIPNNPHFIPFLIDGKQAIQHLSLSKFISPDEISSCIIKSYSEIFAPLFESHF